MAELNVETTYASALYDVAVEENKEDKIFEEIKQLLAVLKENSELIVFLNSHAIHAEEKKKALRAMFEGQIEEKLVFFLCLLIDKRRIASLEGILRAYCKIHDHMEGAVEGHIYSMKPLTEDQLKAFETQTGKLIGENVTLTNYVDDSLIAGVKILVDGRIIDLSYRTQLNKIAKEIRR